MKKYSYQKILQGNYGQGWEDLTSYDCDSSGWSKKEVREEKRADFKAYNENEPQYQHRFILRRAKII